MCTQPLKGFINGKTKNGKDNLIVCSYNVDHIEFLANGTMVKRYDKKVSPSCVQTIKSFVEIPCGKCLQCRLEYSRQWANRCMLESLSHEKNCFITLTYNDMNIPKTDKEYPNSITGEMQFNKTLKKEDFQLFMKRFRKELSKSGIQIRFFACGEYGSQTLRPHYHAIIFGWFPDENDLTLVETSELGYPLYSSKTLEKVWPYGFNIVANMTWETCAYVARYCTKKVNLNNDFYDDNGIEKEFILMSKRPGIGLEWFNAHSECYAGNLNEYLKTDFGSRKISHNKYFDSKLEELDPAAYRSLKETRRYFQDNRNKIKLSETDLDYLEELKIEERLLKNKTKILERREI